MSATDTTVPVSYLEPDDEIRGQSYVCLSFLTPDRTLIRDKKNFFFSEFLKHYAVSYKINATESYISALLRDVQATLSTVSMDLINTEAERRVLAEKVDKVREKVSRETTASMEAHVKEHMADFKESTIVEEFEKFMAVHEQRLEDEFHKANNFRTTVHGLKVRGVYSTSDQAAARARVLQKKDPHFSVYVADVGQWLPWDPNPEQVASSEYANDELNKLMARYKDNQAEKDAFFEEVKRQELAKAAEAAKAQKELLAAKKKEEQAAAGSPAEEQSMA